jgi:hypothetical protein
MNACRTSQAAAARPPSTISPPSNAFHRFRIEYNRERPHQFLDGGAPASIYGPSARRYPGRVPSFEYPGHYLVKRVTNAGTIRFKTRLLFLATALTQHLVGLEEVDDGRWSIHFCNVLLARVDERDYLLRA